MKIILQSSGLVLRQLGMWLQLSKVEYAVPNITVNIWWKVFFLLLRVGSENGEKTCVCLS